MTVVLDSGQTAKHSVQMKLSDTAFSCHCAHTEQTTTGSEVISSSSFSSDFEIVNQILLVCLRFCSVVDFFSLRFSSHFILLGT